MQKKAFPGAGRVGKTIMRYLPTVGFEVPAAGVSTEAPEGFRGVPRV